MLRRLSAVPKFAVTALIILAIVNLLIGVILIMGGLQFFPAQALGPIVEHFQVLASVH